MQFCTDNCIRICSPFLEKISGECCSNVDQSGNASFISIMCKFYEFGSYFIDGDVVPCLIEVSPDGEIRYLLLLIPFSKFNLYTALGLLEQMNVLFNFPGLSI